MCAPRKGLISSLPPFREMLGNWPGRSSRYQPHRHLAALFGAGFRMWKNKTNLGPNPALEL